MARRRSPSFRILILIALTASAGRLQAAPEEGQVTLMDPVFVEASPVSSGAAMEKPWRYLSEPGFEILSRCSNSFNADYTRALRRAAAARLALLPEIFWGDLPTPIKIVLYDRPPERIGFLSSSPIDLSWIAEDSAILGSDSIRLSHPVTLGDGDTFINCGNYWDVQADNSDFSLDVDSSILIENRVPHFPAWFVAGLEGPNGLYVNRTLGWTLRGDSMTLPNALWTSSAETIALQKAARRASKEKVERKPPALLPLERLFDGAVPAEQRKLWNAEAALFVRWGLFGRGDRQAFLDFVDRSAREPITEALFRQHLGIGYSDAQKALGEYLLVAVGEPIAVPFTVPPDEPVNFREATPTEVARILGDWGRLEARSPEEYSHDFRRESLDQADKLYERIFARREDDPLFLAGFGLYELQTEDNLRARNALKAATAAGVVRPRAYVELARLRLEESLPSDQEGIGDLSRDEFAEIVALLNTARLQMPSLRSTYFVLARAFEHAPSKPTLGDLWPLSEGVRLFPQNSNLAYSVATLYRRLGYTDEAASMAHRAIAFAETDGDRSLLSGLLARLAK